MTKPSIVGRAAISAPAALDQRWFSAGGRVIEDPREVLAAFGVHGGANLAAAAPEIVARAVQASPTGVIQDPAGSAIGAPKPVGRGASGAIYGTFPDLLPIPSMKVGAAVFNGSAGAGRRVLHTHAPQLSGAPGNQTDRARALVALADAYANALFAFADRVDALGDDAAVLNLVPISSSIYGGQFHDGRHFATPHLDPSYSLVSFVVAAAHVLDAGARVPATTMCYFDHDVAHRAHEYRKALVAVLAGAG